MPQNLKASSFNLQWQDSFKEIQCYQDHEVNEKLNALLNDDELLSIIGDLFDNNSNSINFQGLRDIDDVDSFQAWVADNLFPYIEGTYQNLTISGLDQLDPSLPYVFVSNHRDIVMDPLILNKALLQFGFSTANCAIGDNLLKHPAANDLALLNRCFKVFRTLKSPRAMLKAMKNQSEYIRYLHFNQTSNIWIAQKEGRAKDNIDKTNPALLKMLGLAKPKDKPLSEYLNALNIVPVCFSYEWDPCDIDKAHELVELETSGNYEKDNLDDFISTKKGLSQDKGRIHVAFGESLSIEPEHDHRDMAELIDKCIHQNYRPYPINYVGFKRINVSSTIESSFSKQDINQASKLLDERIKHESEEVQKRVYAAYSRVIPSE